MKSTLQLLLMLILSLILILFFFIPSELSASILNKIQIDTFGHIIGFFGLSWALIGLLKLPLVNTVICLYFYSALTEIAQYYLGFRSGQFFDFVADVFAISLFATLQWSLIVYGKKQHRNKDIKR
jgi:VanZ family protein